MRYSFDFSIHPLEAEVPIAGGQEGLPGYAKRLLLATVV